MLVRERILDNYLVLYFLCLDAKKVTKKDQGFMRNSCLLQIVSSTRYKPAIAHSCLVFCIAYAIPRNETSFVNIRIFHHAGQGEGFG